MMRAATPVLKDIVLVGAGHAHVGVLRMFGMNPVPGVRLTLITRQVHTPYSGMLPGLIAGTYTFDEAHIDCAPLAAFAGARIYQDEAVGLDLDGKRVVCRGRPPVPYDVLSIDIGSTPGLGGVAGADAHAVPVKPIDGFLERFEAARARVLAARGKASIVVVGGGAGGVELMLALERRLREDLVARGLDAKGISYTIVSASGDILPAFPQRFRGLAGEALAARGIDVVTGDRVARVEEGRLVLESGVTRPADVVFWTTQAAAAPWLRETGLALDANGFIRVGRTLQSVSHPDVFAAGDIAAMDNAPRPKSGVFAVRQGKTLADNLARIVAGRPLRHHRPQREAMYLLSMADGHAIGSRNGFVFSGPWVWRWKDRIDRRFMQKFNELPQMPAEAAPQVAGVADREAIKEISALAMRCGGCGAKVGATVLSRALGAIVPVAREDVVVGLDAPDDAAIVDTGGPLLSVQTIDYFRAIVDDPYIFGKIAANHALGDIYAMGGEPQTALAIATIPYGLEAKVEADLSMMMAGANEILHDAHCALVGGHTSEGAELALGFALNGLVARDKAMRKGGLRPGDALLVTKPIGTGSLLAAHMRAKTKSRWLFAALAHMVQSNRKAAEIIQQHGAHAATDVTGFGLLGHLVEMVRASNVDVSLDVGAVPLLDGLEETMALGIFSSLQPQNVRLRRAIRNLEAAASHPLYPALFDPQTAGGLLAAVPADQAEACLAALHKAGYVRAARIGTVQQRSLALEPVTIDLGNVWKREPEASRIGEHKPVHDARGGAHAHEPIH
ncbi:MAG: selenide, water dikinase SelD [Hyphomicrobiales bacterium]|nr:MAG: selenide, water dikinase SelD [Hyphomicrobiales bacterium]